MPPKVYLMLQKIKQMGGWLGLARWTASAMRCGFQPEVALPQPVLQDQRVQDIAAADAAPTDKAEMPAVIQHIEEEVPNHQPATP